MKLLRLHNYSILDQLYLEETLLRTESDNFCLINEGTTPALVMGRTQKIEEVINIEEMKGQNLPLIRRFSGGGCVVVDENTLFFTLILNKADIAVEPLPQHILSWSHRLLQPAFIHKPLELEGQDFSIARKKIGGNAQSIIKNRFLQHTSFLWSWDKERMKALSHPPKEPNYRRNRSHEEFLGEVQNHFPSKKIFIDQLIASLSRVFTIEEITQETLLLIQRGSSPMNTKVEYAANNQPRTRMEL